MRCVRIAVVVYVCLDRVPRINTVSRMTWHASVHRARGDRLAHMHMRAFVRVGYADALQMGSARPSCQGDGRCAIACGQRRQTRCDR